MTSPQLSSLAGGQLLRTRIEIPSVEKQAEYASEICVIAVSANSLLLRHLTFFGKMLESGGKMRIILLNPNSSSALQTLNLIDGGFTSKSDIEKALTILQELLQIEGAKDRCQIHLSEVFLPFSIFAIDLQKESGAMTVTYLSYRKSGKFRDRPSVFLTRSDHTQWFNFYQEQFEQIWSESTL
jgi:hypothetical protein